ncbi:MAG TPA: GMC family oxidoreductase [Thermoanaerobaculia bacterium]
MSTEPQYDVVIVGAGIAGTIVARELGKAGKKVLILESGSGFQQGTSREAYLGRYYQALAKVPEAPYPGNPYAQRATTLEIYCYEHDAEGRFVQKPGCESYLVQKGPLPFSSTYERQAGGTMWHWLGTSLRMLPSDFRMRTLYHRGMDWPLTYADLEPFYCEAEYLIGVSADVAQQNYHGITFPPDYFYPMERIPPSLTDQAVAAGIQGLVIDGQELSVTSTPAGRNSAINPKAKSYNNGRRMCAGNTSCVPICPIQAKFDPTVTLADALQTGNVQVLYQAVASNVQVDPASGRVSGIDYITYDASGRQGTGTAQGKLYVLAAHAIETPKLLLNSNRQIPAGVANCSSGQVGRNLMDHPVMNAWALMPQPVFPFRGPISTSGIETLRDGEFRRERSAYRIEIHGLGWNWPANAPYSDLGAFVDGQGLFGTALREALNQSVTRQIDINFLVEQLPQEKNRVTLSDRVDGLGIPRPEIHYGLDEYDKRGFRSAFRTAAEIFAKLGARNATNFSGQQSAPNYFNFEGQDFLFQGAGHIVGTYRMGDHRKNSVVDRNQRSWDHENLFLLGSGVFPTIATSNPSLTISALSLMAARTIKRDLEPGTSG